MDNREMGESQPERVYEFDADCRRLRLDEHRQIKAGCQLLTGRDKVLIELYLKGDVDYTQLSKLLGLSRSTIYRRIRQLIKILLGRTDDTAPIQDTLTPVQVAVVRMAVVERLKASQIALKTGLSYYRVHKICKTIGLTPVGTKARRSR